MTNKGELMTPQRIQRKRTKGWRMPLRYQSRLDALIAAAEAEAVKGMEE